MKKVDQEEKRLASITPASDDERKRQQALQKEMARRKGVLNEELKIRDQYHESTRQSNQAKEERDAARRAHQKAVKDHDRLKQKIYEKYKKRPLGLDDLSPSDRQKYLASRDDRDRKKALRKNLIAEEKARSKQRAQLRSQLEKLKADNPKFYQHGPIADPCVHCLSRAVANFDASNKRTKAWKDAFPGRQNYGNCGIQSASQLIQRATGKKIGEKDLLEESVKNGKASPGKVGDPASRGGTSPQQRRDILAAHGVASNIQDTSVENLAKAIKQKKGIIANVDVKELWKPTAQAGGHAIVITDGEFQDGKLTAVYINDTGQGVQRKVKIDDFMKAADAKEGGSKLNVTDAPILP